jgi:hypothetical protein
MTARADYARALYLRARDAQLVERADARRAYSTVTSIPPYARAKYQGPWDLPIGPAPEGHATPAIGWAYFCCDCGVVLALDGVPADYCPTHDEAASC